MEGKIKKVLSLFMMMLFAFSLLPSFSIKSQATTILKDRLLVGYWHNFTNPAGFYTLREIPNEWDVINVSFGITNTNDRATIIFEPEYDEAQFIKDVKYQQSLGKKVLLSLGGETGIVKVESAAAKDRFVKSLISIIDKYGFNGLDIDLEGGSGISVGPLDSDFKNPGSPMLVNLINGIEEVCNKYGDDFMLTMAPETLYVQGGFSSYGGTSGGYLPIIYALRDKLTYIHVQDYNTGGMLGLDGKNYTQSTADFHVAMTEMLLKGFTVGGDKNNMFPALDAEQVMFGVPSCPSAAGGGYTDYKELEKALNYLIKGESFGGKYKLQNESGYSDLRGIMTWSATWDVSKGNPFATFFRNYFDNLKIPEKSLRAANISASEPFNGKFTLSIKVPERNTAKTYTILENGKEIYSGDLNVGSSRVQTIPYKFINKESGSYIYEVKLTDKAGQSVKSNKITVNVPQKIEGSSLPDRIMVGYWHNFYNDAGFIKLSEVSPEWDVINVSFAVTTHDRSVVEFIPEYDEEEFMNDIYRLQMQGKKVVLSLGGQDGVIQIPDDESYNKFITSLIGLIDKYGFDGIDIDLESGSNMSLKAGDTDINNPKTPQITNLIKAIKSLDKRYGRDFIISMAPEVAYVQGGITAYGNIWGAYLPLINGVRDELDYLQVQHYNCGGNAALDGVQYSHGTADFQVAMVDMLLTGFNIANNPNNRFEPLRDDQIVIGIPATAKAAPAGGYIAPNEMKKALDYLIKGVSFGGSYKMESGKSYPNIRGMMTWSINWDLASGSTFINSYRPYFDSLTSTENTLKPAYLSYSMKDNNSYDLIIDVPARNKAISYKLYEGTSEIASGSLTSGSSNKQVIKKNIANKAVGSYKYKVVLYDADGNKVNSNEITVKILDSTEDPNKTDINKDGKVDVTDLSLVASKYNSKSTDSNYDLKLDMNNDKIIDLFDIVIVSKDMEKIEEVVYPEYDENAEYGMGDIVTYQGKIYESIWWWHKGVTPGTNDSCWKLKS